MQTKTGLLKEIRLGNFGLNKKQNISLPSGITLISGKYEVDKKILFNVIRLAFGLKLNIFSIQKTFKYLTYNSENRTVELILNNPKYGENKWFFRSGDALFDKRYFSNSEVRIQIAISPKSEISFKLYDFSAKKFVKMNDTLKKKLFMSYSNIGIPPISDLIFYSLEEFLRLFHEKSENGYAIFINKLGLRNALEKFEQILEDLSGKEQELLSLEKHKSDSKKTLQKLKQLEQKVLIKQNLEKELEGLYNELKWTPFLYLENEFQYYNTLSEKRKEEIKELKEEINKKKLEIKNIEETLRNLKKLFKEKSKVYNEKKELKTLLEFKRSDLTKDLDKLLKKKKEFEKKINTKISKINELKEQINTFQEVNEEDLINQYNNKIEELKHKLNNLNLKLKQVTHLMENRKNELFKVANSQNSIITEKKRNNPNSKGNTLKENKYFDVLKAFKDMLNAKGLSSKIKGPLFSELKVKPGNEKWIEPVSYILSSILTDFVAINEDSFKIIQKIKNNTPQFREISIAWVDQDKLPPLLNKEKEKDLEVIKNILKRDVKFLYSILEGDDILIKYAIVRGADKVILVDTIDVNLVENIIRNFPDIDFYLTNGEIMNYIKGTGKLSPLKKQKYLIGNNLTEILNRGSDNISDLNIPRSKNNQILGIEELLDKDDVYSKLKGEYDELNKDITRINSEILKLTNEKESNLYSNIIKEKQDEIARIEAELTSIREDLDNINTSITKEQNKIKENKEKISLFEKEFFDLEKEYEELKNKFRKGKKKLDSFKEEFKSMEDKLNEKQKEMESINQKITKLNTQIKKFEQEHKNLQRPQKIREKIVIEELINQVRNKLKSSSKLSEDVEKKYNELKNMVNNIQQVVNNYKKSIELMRKEANMWRSKIDSLITKKIEQINNAFNNILQIFDASGTIKVESGVNKKLSILVQFADVPLKLLEEHDDLHKQIGIIAFILAIISLSSSPITTLDLSNEEYLSIINKKDIFQKICGMGKKALDLKSLKLKTKISPQLFLLTSKISKLEFTQEINFVKI